MAELYCCTIGSPIDPLTLVCDSSKSALCGLYMSSLDGQPYLNPEWTLSDCVGVLHDAAIELESYFARGLTEFTVPLASVGTTFQHTVWDELVRIPYGQTISYGELAKRIGNPLASRAVGLANGSNPISIIVPCHRVIGANGKLTGFGGGLRRKEFLLGLERGIAEFAGPSLPLFD